MTKEQTAKEVEMMKYQVPDFFGGGGEELYDAMYDTFTINEGSLYTALLFYNLGLAHGVRKERARRKLKKQLQGSRP